MELEETKNQLISWLGNCKHSHYKEEDFICIDDDRVYMKIYTDNNYYSITAYPESEKIEKGYLGCVASCRKPITGEDWTRGADLADGPFKYDTWVKILSDIVDFELVKIHKSIKDE